MILIVLVGIARGELIWKTEEGPSGDGDVGFTCLKRIIECILEDEIS